MAMPDSVGLQRVYLESKGLDDVGYSYYDVLGGDECPDLLKTLGRHLATRRSRTTFARPSAFSLSTAGTASLIDDLARRSAGNINLRKGKRPDMWGTSTVSSRTRPYTPASHDASAVSPWWRPESPRPVREIKVFMPKGSW